MRPDLQRNAVYVSSPKITPEDVERFYHIFDTEVESDLYDPVADYIRAVPDATWALNLDPKAIYARHRELNNSAFLLQPAVIMDDRTKEDDTVLLLYPVHDYDEEGGDGDLDYKVQELRCAPRSLTPVLQNLEIGNMDFEEFQDGAGLDGVFRGFPGPEERPENVNQTQSNVSMRIL